MDNKNTDIEKADSKNTDIDEAAEKEAEIQTQRHRKRIQIISIVCILAVLAVATVCCIPLIKTLSSEKGLDGVVTKLKSYSGPVGLLVFLFIQALQVVIAVIPPIQAVGGVLFGWFWGGVLSYAGTFIGTLAIFWIVKKFGRPVVEAFVNEKQMKKFGFLQDEKKLTIVLVILYLIPGIPKDVISYIVPLTPISKKDFFMYVMPCRLPAILLSTAFGNSILKGKFTIVLIILGITLAVGLVGYLTKDVIVDKIKQHQKDK